MPKLTSKVYRIDSFDICHNGVPIFSLLNKTFYSLTWNVTTSKSTLTKIFKTLHFNRIVDKKHTLDIVLSGFLV